MLYDSDQKGLLTNIIQEVCFKGFYRKSIHRNEKKPVRRFEKEIRWNIG